MTVTTTNSFSHVNKHGAVPLSVCNVSVALPFLIIVVVRQVGFAFLRMDIVLTVVTAVVEGSASRCVSVRVSP